MNLPTLPVTGKGSQTGRVLLRRSGTVPPLPGLLLHRRLHAYFAPEVRRQLRRLAADRDTTLQALLGEAVNDLFAKHGLPELVKRD